MPSSFATTPRLQFIALALFTFGLYVNTLGHDYALDDAIVITDNVIVRDGLSRLGELFTHDSFYGFFQDDEKASLVAGGRYRPLTLALFAVEQQLFGAPFWHHLFNVLWYVALVLLIFQFFRRIAGRVSKSVWWLPLAAAALFAAHPLHTEAVANIKGRDEILALLGCVAATYFCWLAAERRFRGGAVAASLAIGGAGLLAMLSKENAITFAAVIPLVLYFLRKDAGVGDLRYALPFWAAAAVFLVLRTSVIGLNFGEPVLELMNNPFLVLENGRYVPMDASTRLATVFHTLLDYLRLLFVPTGLVHDYYPAAVSPKSWTDLSPWLSVLLHGGLLALIPLTLRPRPKESTEKRGYLNMIGVGIATYLLTLSIVSNLFFSVGTFMSERFLFMPSFGFALAVMGLAGYVGKQWTAYALAAVIALFSVGTVVRNPVWRDNFTLFTTDVERQPDSAKLLNAAAGTKIDHYQSLPEQQRARRQNLLTEAVGHLNRAVTIHPAYRNAYLLRGNAYLLLEQFDAAIADYDRALEFSPDYRAARDNLVIALARAGKFAGEQRGDLNVSIAYLKRAEQLAPRDFETLRLLGVAHGIAGRAAEAAEYFRRALEVDPRSEEARRGYETALREANSGSTPPGPR